MEGATWGSEIREIRMVSKVRLLDRSTSGSRTNCLKLFNEKMGIDDKKIGNYRPFDSE